jgi:hypothetical protein
VVETQNKTISVTISIGSATYRPSKRSHLSSAEIGADLIRQADEAFELLLIITEDMRLDSMGLAILGLC